MMDPAAMAGSGVVVNGLESVLGAGELVQSNLLWNFGDSSGAHNTLGGFNASHVYANAGTYTVTLTVTNINGKSSTASAKIVIAADTRTKIYVNSVSGNDSNNGLTQATAVKTAARATALLGNDVEVLFACGQTFNMTTAMNLSYSNVLLGSYGSGAQPVLNFTANQVNAAILSTMSANSVAVTIQDLELTTMAGTPLASIANPVFAINVGGYDVAVLRCTFIDVEYGMQAVGYVTGFTVFDDTSPSATGLDAYFVWGTGGSDFAIVGCTVAGSVDQHDIRTEETMDELLEDNNLTNSDGRGCIEMHVGGYMWIEGNTANGGDIRVGPRGGDTEADTTTTVDCVIEDNKVYDSEIRVTPGAQHIMIRDNEVESTTGDFNIEVTGQDTYGRQVEDVYVLNNTGYETLQSGQFLSVQDYVDGLVVENNLYVAPIMQVGSYDTAPVYDDASSLSGWTLVTNNVWQTPINNSLWANGGVNFVDEGYLPAGELTPAEWNALSQVGTDLFTTTTFSLTTFAPSTTSSAATAGVVLNDVYGDINGAARPTSGTWSAGAVQV
jgi:PKD repeat protein